MTTTVRHVVDQLSQEGLIEAGEHRLATAYIERHAIAQPWYIRTMVGLGAWLASLLLIGFVAGFTFTFDGGFAVVGIMFIAVAIWARRQSDNDFLVQCTLAVSLAGQVLFAWGLVAMEWVRQPEAYCVIVIAMSTLLFVVFRDRIHQVLMLLFAAASVVALFFLWELNALVPVLGPAFAAALVVVYDNQGRMIARGWGAYVRPLINGLALTAFGCLLLSTVYILPELSAGEIRLYPRPWISTILLGGLLLWVGTRIWRALGGRTATTTSLVFFGSLLLVIASSYAAPGILFALIIVILGAAVGHRSFAGAGVGFLAVFVGAYFYGIEVTMLTKSITLIATGSAILLARWLILAVTRPAIPDGGSDA